jgi:hypothetical protein
MVCNIFSPCCCGAYHCQDFVPYFRSTSEAVSFCCCSGHTISHLYREQHAAFQLFDKDGNGDISKKEMRDAVQRIYRERKSLIAGLKVRKLVCVTWERN